MGLFRKRFYEAAEAHQRAKRKQRRWETLSERILWGAVASFLLQCFAAPLGLFPPWMIVIGIAPMTLILLLGLAVLIWIWARDWLSALLRAARLRRAPRRPPPRRVE